MAIFYYYLVAWFNLAVTVRTYCAGHWRISRLDAAAAAVVINVPSGAESYGTGAHSQEHVLQ